MVDVGVSLATIAALHELDSILESAWLVISLFEDLIG